MPAPTFRTPLAAEYRRAGGAWDRPSLDELLTRVAPPQSVERVARVAGGLRRRGVGSGDVVAWQSPNRDEVALLCRAAWRLGAVAAPVHHQLGPAEVRARLAALDPRTIVEDLDALPDGPPVDESWTDVEALAVVLFTSGSSGAPKGVLHTQATLAYKAETMRAVHGLGADDCVLMPAPCAHISGLLNGIVLPGVVPFRVVFMARWDAQHALELIERERVTFMVGPPTYFVGLMQASGFTPRHVRTLRLVSSGGAGVSAAFVAAAAERLGARVRRTYGSTEAPTIVTDGAAIGAVELRLDGDELLVRGPEVCAGYLDPAQTAAAFTADGWFRTGDRATLDPIEILGRRDDGVVIRGGENVSTTEVEAVLEAHPDVHHAVAFAYPDDLMGERIAAFVVGTSSFDVAAARAWFAAQGIATFKAPERVVVIDDLPLLPNGKADRAALRRILDAPA